jgi:hypothetical protein
MYPGFGGSRTVQPLLLSNITLPVLVARCPLCPGLLPLRVCPPAASALVCPPFIHQLYPHVAPDENSHGYPGPPRSSPSCQTFSSHLNKFHCNYIILYPLSKPNYPLPHHYCVFITYYKIVKLSLYHWPHYPSHYPLEIIIASPLSLAILQNHYHILSVAKLHCSISYHYVFKFYCQNYSATANYINPFYQCYTMLCYAQIIIYYRTILYTYHNYLCVDWENKHIQFKFIQFIGIFHDFGFIDTWNKKSGLY